jgi:hypothetical protein
MHHRQALQFSLTRDLPAVARTSETCLGSVQRETEEELLRQTRSKADTFLPLANGTQRQCSRLKEKIKSVKSWGKNKAPGMQTEYWQILFVNFLSDFDLTVMALNPLLSGSPTSLYKYDACPALS